MNAAAPEVLPTSAVQTGHSFDIHAAAPVVFSTVHVGLLTRDDFPGMPG